MTSVAVIREFNIPRRRPPRKRPLKSELAFFQSLSWLFQLTYFAKCKWTLLELNSQQPYPSSKSERKFGHPSTKREIRYFHVVVLQWRQRNVHDRVMQVKSRCFAFSTHCLFGRSRCRRRRVILNSLLWLLLAMHISLRLCYALKWKDYTLISVLLYRVLESVLQITCLVFMHKGPRIFK